MGRLRPTYAFALALLLAGCHGSGGSDETRTGVRLTVEFESTLDILTIDVFGQLLGDARPLERTSHPVPISVEPPGFRQVELAIDVPAGPAVLRAEGFSGDGVLFGSGSRDVNVISGKLVPAKIILSLPVDFAKCGDGRTEPGEGCDDGNIDNGDGCSASCRVEIADLRHAWEIEQLETQTTTSASWVAIPGTALSFAPNQAGETWLLFASGKLRSDDPSELTAELRLMVGGEEAGMLGHQTTGITNNWAGFVTFDRIDAGAGDVSASLEFRALVGTTEADDLRLVALRVPDGADLQYLEIDPADERTGSRLDLGTLRFTPQLAGDYLVFAQLSQSELPGGDTVRSWVEDDLGARHPNDDNGSGYSNARASWAPLFVAFSQALDQREHAFTLRGTSSADGDSLDWWDPAWDHRFPIAISAGTFTPSGYSIALSFDHAALVAAGQSSPGGEDVRVVFRGVELDRVLDPDSAWNQPDTLIWFATPNGIDTNGGGSGGYDLYHGNPLALPPPADPALVFPLFDDFDGTALDPNLWIVEAGAPALSGGELVLGPNTRVRRESQFAEDTIWEVKSRLSAPVGVDLVWLGGSSDSAGTNQSLSWYSDGSDHHAETNGVVTHFEAATPTDFHLWRIARDGGAGVYFLQDDSLIAAHQTIPVGPLQPYLSNGSPLESISYDWLRIRSFVRPGPEVALGVQESLRGGLPCTWVHRKIMALRAGSFDAVQYAESLDAGITDQPAFQPKAELTSATPPDGAHDYVSIQSLRISGQSDENLRKSGELRAGGETLLATSHKIPRSSEEQTGYHHTAGAVDLRSSDAPVAYQNGFSSPDGGFVRAAESVIILLRFPR